MCRSVHRSRCLNSSKAAPQARTEPHTYGIERKATSADLYRNGQLKQTYKTSDLGGAHTILFTVGKYDTRATMTGAADALKVNYARVWKP